MRPDLDTDEEGVLGRYGVVLVPPADEAGGWLVALACWSSEQAGYGAEPEGPILDTREQALEYAGKLVDWIATQNPDADLGRIWRQMRLQAVTSDGLPPPFQPRGPYAL
ncbi:MAG: hypothetical protein ACRDFX_09220 [Chloroflexota bacterium]